jgi:hypothetical protein
MLAGAAFLRGVVAAFPHWLHTILTDNGVPCTDQPRNRSGPTAQYRVHAFDRVSREHAIFHKLTKPYHPWTTDEVEYTFRAAVLFSARLRMTSRRRVGLEVKAWPRCLHCRSSVEASAGARLLPRLVHPWVNRL